MVCVQSRHFFDNNGLMPQLNSVYRRLYSTEAAVTKVFNDLSQAANRGHMSALCLLGATVAFDTIHHSLLLYSIFNSPQMVAKSEIQIN